MICINRQKKILRRFIAERHAIWQLTLLLLLQCRTEAIAYVCVSWESPSTSILSHRLQWDELFIPESIRLYLFLRNPFVDVTWKCGRFTIVDRAACLCVFRTHTHSGTFDGVNLLHIKFVGVFSNVIFVLELSVDRIIHTRAHASRRMTDVSNKLFEIHASVHTHTHSSGCRSSFDLQIICLWIDDVRISILFCDEQNSINCSNGDERLISWL